MDHGWSMIDGVDPNIHRSYIPASWFGAHAGSQAAGSRVRVGASAWGQVACDSGVLVALLNEASRAASSGHAITTPDPCGAPRPPAVAASPGELQQRRRPHHPRIAGGRGYAAPGPDYLVLKQSQWPETFSALKPIRISCHRDGFSITLTDDSIHETGLHIQPLGITNPPSPGSVKYEHIEEGIYWYSLRK